MRNLNLTELTLNWMRRDQFRSSARGTLWPSEASVRYLDSDGKEEIVGRCLRATHYRLTGQRPSNLPSDHSEVIFHMGKKIEDGIIELWKQAGIWDNNSVKFEDKSLNLSGEFDCIIRHPETKRKFGVEVKSYYGYYQGKGIEGYYEGRGSSRVYIPGVPKDEHLLQTAIYADQTRGTLEGFKIFYISRDNNVLSEFSITVQDDSSIYIKEHATGTIRREERFTVEDIYRRYREQNQLMADSKVPIRDFIWMPSDQEVQRLFNAGKISKTAYTDHQDSKKRYTDWHCSYCSYKDVCWKPDGTPND